MAPRIPFPGNRWVRLIKQLQTGSPTSSTDCGPCADLHAEQFASGADWRIAKEDQDDAIAALRSEMTHGPTWPATRLADQWRGMTSALMRGVFLAFGKRRPLCGTYTTTHDAIIKGLAEGRIFVVAVNYGTVNDLMPALSGSPTFRGGHAIVLQGLVRQNGVAWSRLGDSLHDGRRVGIPRGWQVVRTRRYLRAAETWGSPPVGKGRAAIIRVTPASDISD